MYKLFLVFIMVMLMAGCSNNKSKMPSMTASDILHRTEQTYVSCKSYKDTGTAYVSKPSALPFTKTTITKISFKTVFMRPCQFRFEYTNKDNLRHIVWTSKGKAYWWWTIDSNVRKEASLNDAIAGATGVSCGTAHTVPRLLMSRNITGWNVTDLRNPKLLSSESIDGTACFRIESKDSKIGIVTIWIGESDFLLRRIVRETKNPLINDVYTTTTIYHPRANVKIPHGTFKSGVKE